MWRSETPVILTTSQLLTTGVDAPTCKNVALARVVGSMAEFKQIIGRGTRLREDYGKLWFNILDYTGTATEKFADPAFDGEPADEITTEIDAEGEVVSTDESEPESPGDSSEGEDGTTTLPPDEPEALPRKFYVDGGEVEVVAHLVYDLDSDGKRLTCRKLTDWTGEKVRTLVPHASGLPRRVGHPGQAQRRSSTPWPNAGSILSRFRSMRAAPMTIRSICCVISPGTLR